VVALESQQLVLAAVMQIILDIMLVLVAQAIIMQQEAEPAQEPRQLARMAVTVLLVVSLVQVHIMVVEVPAHEPILMALVAKAVEVTVPPARAIPRAPMG
jgi:hypothetical protein